MIQLTQVQRQTLRERVAKHPELVAAMKQRIQRYLDEPVNVPSSGIANWTLYYYCPECSVELIFDPHDNENHYCPRCGKNFTGEPYNSSWWGKVNFHNYSAAVTLGWLYVMTDQNTFAERAKDILLAYADNYPNYQVHGDIPYNGPGRAGAQTLDEANFQRSLVFVYDLISETLSEEDKNRIREQLFIPGAEFLMEHRHNQLHNHEVIINSAIAAIGMCFDREDMINFALYTPYGIRYQLENGMLENGFWFEGSIGYHFYALKSFFAYEQFARNTQYSMIHHPNYEKMMNVIVDYLQPDGSLPMIGDTNYGHSGLYEALYEFAYSEIGGDKMLYMLHNFYKKIERNSLEAIVYGVEELPPCPNYKLPSSLRPDVGHSGHTVLRNPNGKYLLFKHDRFGGEHDHYDRLGLSYYAFGKPCAPDMGTTGYGAVLHYDYYKNTGTNNTVVIDEENQAPAHAVMTRYEERDGVIYVEAVCDWNAPFDMPDTFTIVQWNEEAYRKVKMRRAIAWTDAYFAERFIVDGVDEGRTIDWTMHVQGTRVKAGEETPVERLSEKKPFKYIHDVTSMDAKKDAVHTFIQEEGTTRIFSAAFDGERLIGTGPGNPSYLSIEYVIERTCGGNAEYAHVVESFRDQKVIDHVEFNRDHIVVFHVDGSRKVLAI